MKKLLLAMLAFLLTVPVMRSQQVKVGDFAFEVSDPTLKHCTLVSANRDIIGEAVIPATVLIEDEEYQVTALGDDCFYESSELTSVIIPEGVTSLGINCFSLCSSLASVTLPESVKSIGAGCFAGCSALTSVTLPENMTSLGGACFAGCSALTYITIPENVTALENSCFSGCKKLATVNLPSKLESLGESCFRYCHSLREIALPESLKVIGTDCFYDSNLSMVKFGKNIESLAEHAFRLSHHVISYFEGGENLRYIGYRALGDGLRVLSLVTKTPPEIQSANMGYSEDEAYNILVIVPANCDDAYKNDPKWQGFHIVEAAPTKTVHMTGRYSLAEEITTTTQQMPGAVTSLAITGPLADDDWILIQRNLISCYDLDLSGVTNTEIPANAFAGNQHMLYLKLPKGLKTIGADAFKDCSNLSIDGLPASLETIGDNAFAGCSKLELSELPASLRTIGANAFQRCTCLQLTSLPALESLGESAFVYCPRFMEIDMSACRIAAIEPYTFANCTKLRNVVLPETLTSIGEAAFEGTAVNFITFPESLVSIAVGAFRGTPLIAVDLLGKVENVGSSSFLDCALLKSVSMTRAMKQIGDGAFSGCRALRSISVPSPVPPTVGENAFNNVRYRDCMVSIPTLNYREYLSAPGWGAFTQLSNSIFLDYEEVDENGDTLADGEEESVDVGVVENSAYDEIVENILNEEEQAAEDVERDNALFGDDSPAELEARVARARANARRQAQATVDTKARRAFTRLYSGTSFTVGDNTGYRVRIEPKEGATISRIEYGGRDITASYVDGIVTLPTVATKGKLRVYRKAASQGVETVNGAWGAEADVYNLQGIPVMRRATEAQVRELPAGLYIYKGRKIVIH